MAKSLKDSGKVDFVKFWWGLLLGYMMLAWIVLHFFMRLSEVWLIAAFVVYLLVSAIVCRAYVIGMIGNYYYFTRRQQTALKYFEKAVKLKTFHVKAMHIYAVHLLQEGQPEEALELLKREQSINTKVLYDKLIPLAMASCYWVMGDVDRAIDTIESLKKKYTYLNPDTMTTLGYFYLLKGDIQKATEITQKALEDNPRFAPALDNMGQINYSSGNYSEALEYFEKALELRPNMPESLYYSALIYKSEGNTDKARENLEKANGLFISTLSTVKKEQIEAALNSL
jgi:tetratricopeptide (TPR) repeat protein